ncbi:GntR family transcriptional regulator [Cryptosporangium sp. NPDC048952]|uniref:GntR family transcriptional regulator n=1 Tax=Cryptosporangium sp. NPDC048952 TaxID=3363961 RepID=UPI0037174452
MTDATIRRRRPQLSDEVVTYLRDQIMSGELRPGVFVRLDEVAATLGVSITPVREALLTLRGEDMVELEPRRGYRVAPLSRQDIVDVFELQGHVAGQLVARAAASITAEQLADLRTHQEGLRAASSAEEVEDREFEFHRTLNRIADARKLSWFLHTALRYTPVSFYSSDPGWRASMLTAHDDVLDALEAGDAERATAEMARHFTDGAERLLTHLDAQNFWASE